LAVLGVIAYHANFLPGSIGARGVDLFFVISGLCLSLPVLRAGRELQRSKFWINRFWRIVPTYWIALGIFALLSLTAFGLPSALVPKRAFELPQEALFFTGFTPAYNSSFWTLEFETHWYIFFPFILVLFMKSRPWFFALLVGLYLWYLTPVRVPDAGMLPCFMLGIVAADLYLRKMIGSKFLLAGAAAFLALAIVLRGDSNDHGDPLWHVAAFCVVLAGLGVASKALSWEPLAFIGVASYSIYLVHGPVLAWMHDTLHLPMFLAALGSLVAGILFWLLVERPISKPEFRAAVTSLFSRRPKPSTTTP
jgi:exopolysaccharide production protein ExoZ